MVTTEFLKTYLGHTNPWGGAIGDYVQVLIAIMLDSHRRFIQHIPPTERVFKEAVRRLVTMTPEIPRAATAADSVKKWMP